VLPRRFGMLLFLWTITASPAGAAGIELISRAPLRLTPHTTGGTSSFQDRPAVSADGRYVAFVSFAANLVPGQIDHDLYPDVFLYDRVAGTTRLVSHADGSPETAGDRESEQPSLSADGRFVAFASAARNLVPGVGPVGEEDRNVYLWDRETDQTTLVSRSAGTPSLSADGNVLVFTSKATGLVPGLTLAHPGENVYLYERASGTVTLVSRSAASASRSGDNSSYGATVSTNGRFVAYRSSATDLVAGQSDTNGPGEDIFLFDRATGVTALVSHAAGSALTTPDFSSQDPSLSADGRYVAFGSFATDLVPGVPDTDRQSDAFLYDRLSGTVSLVSLAGNPPGAASGGFKPEISEDGSTVLYFTADPASHSGGQIVAYDVPTGSRGLVTRAPESTFTHANAGASDFSMSADGRIVAFTTRATNLVAQEDPHWEAADTFVHDRATGATVLASHAAGSPSGAVYQASFLPSLSADGSWLAHVSLASDLVPGVRDETATGDLFLYERATGVNRSLTLHPLGLASLTLFRDSQEPSLSADGRYVAFTRNGTGLLPGLTIPDGVNNVYLHDRVTRRTVLVSRSSRSPFAGGNSNSYSPRVSRDGSVVVFTSEASDLVPGQEDSAGSADVFLWDRRTGRTTLVSHARASRTRAGAAGSVQGSVSADGNVVVFTSAAPDLVARQREANGEFNVFVWDRRTGTTTQVSRNGSFYSSMSPDGAFIVFSNSSRTPGAFVYERRTGRTSPLGRAGGGQPLISADGRWAAVLSPFTTSVRGVVLLDRATGDVLEITRSDLGSAYLYGMSDDGRWVLFGSDATGLVPGQVDDERSTDLFLFDRVSRTSRLLSHVPGDPSRAVADDIYQARLSPNGRWISFQTGSPLLLPAPNLYEWLNVFLYDRTAEDATPVSRSAFDPGQGGNRPSFNSVVTDGGIVAFDSFSSNLVPRDFNFSSDVFVYIPENP
jgi:Tol biopolymer transport system component